MNKFYGKVGFWFDDVEIRPGVHKPQFVERTYYGELLRNTNRWQSSQSQDENLTVSNKISILSDPYAHEHWPAIKYVYFNGVRWTVTSVEIAYPRLIFELGGVYNGVNGPSSTT